MYHLLCYVFRQNTHPEVTFVRLKKVNEIIAGLVDFGELINLSFIELGSSFF